MASTHKAPGHIVGISPRRSCEYSLSRSSPLMSILNLILRSGEINRMSPTTTSAATAPTHESSSDNAAWAVEVLGSVWERQRDRVDGLIATIEQAVSALADDHLDAKLQADAERAAHMLAGSVGMFGFTDASAAAGELESELAHTTPGHAPMLSALLARLRSGVQGPVVVGSDATAEQ
jgi:HPt (histidine-containing phosphotransfer) domain-containing protein